MTIEGKEAADGFWDKAPVPDEAFQKIWGGCLPMITNWADWRFAPRHLNMTEANAWSYQIGSRETIHLSSGDTLVRRPGNDNNGLR